MQVVPQAKALTLEEGGTIFLEEALEIPAARLTAPEADYEAMITGIVATGVVVHPRADDLAVERRGNKAILRFRYALHAEPGAKGPAKARYTLNLVERKGLANSVVQKKMEHTITITGATAKREQLAADFWGYRQHDRQARELASALEARGLRGVSMKDQQPLPSLDRVTPNVFRAALDFDRARRRAWIAHRHLVAAVQSPDPALANLARAFVKALDRPDDQLKELPAVPLIPGQPSDPKKPEAPQTMEPVGRAPAGGGGGGSGTLAPVGAYDPNAEPEEREIPPRERPEDDPVEPEPPPPVATPAPPSGDDDDDELPTRLSDDPFGPRRLRRQQLVPSYARGLVLEDPNIAFGGGVRMAWAHVEAQDAGVAAAFFYFAQVAITRSLGVEVSVPTQYVNLDHPTARSVYALGNPLISAKYRLHLPSIEGRAPALTLRARYGIPMVPAARIPTTNYDAQTFSREAHFNDAYAFFADKTDVGLGVSLAWAYDIFQLGVQLGGDYFIPLAGTPDQSRFFTLGYGASFGVLPWGELVGFFAEFRATSLLAGPGRTELFAYAGARGRLAGIFEPGIWVGMPFGSVREVSGPQLGLELRVSYDMLELIGPAARSTSALPRFD